MEIRRFDRETVTGFLSLGNFLRPAGIEYLTPQGELATVPLNDVRVIFFVRDFTGKEAETEESRVFLTRPKTAGLWIHVEFRDGEVLEGILPNDLLSVEAAGFTITPPGSGNYQRAFIPRSAIRRAQVLGVIGSPLKRVKKKPKAEQAALFEGQ